MQDYLNFIKLAQTGHYALFPEKWVLESLQSGEVPKYRNANKNVREVFKTLSKHKSLQKKQTVLMSLPDDKRQEFIRSFYCVVEHNLLNEVKTLQ